MALSSFCGLLTLQVGSSILAAVFFTLAAVILAANIFDYHYSEDGWPISLILMTLFVIGLITIGVLMFISSYSESRTLALTAVVLIVILFCYWIILCCFSFVSNPGHVNAICIDTRCPESFWIANLGYRRQHSQITVNMQTKRKKRFSDENGKNVVKVTMPTRYDALVGGIAPKKYAIKDGSNNSDMALNTAKENPGIKNILPKHINITMRESILGSETHILPGSETENEYYFKQSNGTKIDEEKSRLVVGFPFIGAVLLFVVNASFLLFSMFTMWSWASELDWADYYIEDEPVVLVQESYDY